MHRRSFLTSTLAAGASAAFGGPVQSLRVAVIGHTGRGDYGHGLDTLWLGLPSISIVAVADPDDSGRTKALKRLKTDRGFSDYRDMLNTVKPDIVSIALRHIDQHHDMVLAAVDAGVKGIYIEKPFCRDLLEADSMINVLEKSGARLAIAHRLRYHPVLPVIKSLIMEGAIGQVLEIRTRGKEDHRGGPLDLWVLGTHLLNLATCIAGDAVACSASILKEGLPVTKLDVTNGDEGIGPTAGDEVHARFETSSGIPVFYDCVRNKGVREASFGMQIIGNQGVIDFRLDVDQHSDGEPVARLIHGCPFLPPTAPRSWTPITSAGLDKPEPIEGISKLVRGHHAAIHDLIAAIEEDREPLCNAKEGRSTVEMIFAVFESHRQHGARIAFPLKEKRHPLLLL